MRVSVVIPMYNAAATIAACLDACRRQTLEPFEIIVADDGSNDGSGSIVAGQTDIVHVRQENGGPAAARNLGARNASGDIVAFTDADCVPQPDWLEALVAKFEAGVVGVGGTYGIANPESLLARLVHAEIQARHARFGEEVDFLGSFNVAYRREDFVAAGGFDEAFTAASGEDNDLAYRLQDRGGRLRFTPEAVVAHHHPFRLCPYLRTQARHGYWRALLYRKHPGRARTGDRYAGRIELLGPPFALGLLFLAPWVAVVAAAGPARLMPLWAYGLLCGIYAGLHLWRAGKLAFRQRRAELLLLALLTAVRDPARGMGMAVGIWRFLLRRSCRT